MIISDRPLSNLTTLNLVLFMSQSHMFSVPPTEQSLLLLQQEPQMTPCTDGAGSHLSEDCSSADTSLQPSLSKPDDEQQLLRLF